MRRVQLTLLFALAALLFLPACATKPKPIAKHGVLDLRKWDFTRDGTVTLRGDWAFYWKKILSPQKLSQLEKGEFKHPKNWFVVPGYWNNVKGKDGKPLGPFGFATLRLKIRLPTSAASLPEGLQLFSPNQRTANRLWIVDEHGKTLTRPLKNGVVGQKAETHEPRILSDNTRFRTKSKSLTIVLQVSNYSHTRGGPYKLAKLGSAKVLSAAQQYTQRFNAFLLGFVAFMAFYHFLLFAFKRDEFSPLWFACFCTIIGIRILLVNGELYSFAQSEFLWDAMLRFEYISVFASVALPLLFIHSIYPKVYKIKVVRFFVGIALLFTLVTLLVPTLIATRILGFFFPVVLFSLIYILVLLVRIAFTTKDVIANLILLSFFLGGLTMVNDMLHAQNVIRTAYISGFGLIQLIIFQAVVLSIINQRNRRAIEIFTKQLEQQSKAAERFVPHSFLELLGKQSLTDIQLGDHTQRHMSILFSDIRSFTTLSEQMHPQENFTFINDYLAYMDKVVQENEGFVDKYIGDAVMALFSGKADSSLQAGIGMLQALKQFNTEREQSGVPPIDIGIGINTGEVMLGTIGGRYRMDGTVISDAVNLADRVEGMTKRYKVALLITEHTYRSLEQPEVFSIREIDKVVVKGKVQPVLIYEVFDGDAEALKQAKLATQENFEQALAFYRDKHFQEAKDLLEFCKEQSPDDYTIQVYLERCEEGLLRDPNLEWDGVVRMESK